MPVWSCDVDPLLLCVGGALPAFVSVAATVATVTAFSADYAVEGVKGFYDGYHFGLYKKTSHSIDECLDKTTE